MRARSPRREPAWGWEGFLEEKTWELGMEERGGSPGEKFQAGGRSGAQLP